MPEAGGEKIYRRKLMKVGGSTVVPLPKEIRHAFGIGAGDYVIIQKSGLEHIFIKKERKPWHERITKRD